MKTTYQVIILDDEPPARELMQVFVARMPDLHCVASCSNAMQGLRAIHECQPDLVLLDIRMPEMTGLELMKLPLAYQPDIILTTAYPDYALESYEHSVLDYLLKPIAFERFTKAIVRFRQKRESHSGNKLMNEESTISRSVVAEAAHYWATDERSVWLREEKRLRQIPYKSIYYVEGLKDYVKVHLAQETIVTHVGIGQAEKIFPAPHFVRIHRSYIVRKAAIGVIDGNSVTLSNHKVLTLGPNYRDDLHRYIIDLPKF